MADLTQAEMARAFSTNGRTTADEPIPGHSASREIEQACALLRAVDIEPTTMQMLVVDGTPPSKARPRVTGKGHVYVPEPQRVAEEAMKWHLRTEFRTPYTGNVALVARFFRPTMQRIDVDNLMKHLLDCANGIVVEDDSQITTLFGTVDLDRERPRTVIVVAPYENTAFVRGSVELTCAGCGKTFSRRRSDNLTQRSTAGFAVYCSPTCRPPRNKATVSCASCGREFERRLAAQRFCSPTCRNQARTIHAATYCRSCGRKTSKPGYGLCRDCWRDASKRR